MRSLFVLFRSLLFSKSHTPEISREEFLDHSFATALTASSHKGATPLIWEGPIFLRKRIPLGKWIAMEKMERSYLSSAMRMSLNRSKIKRA